MLGFIALFALVAGAMTVFAAIAVVSLVVKLVFKIVLFPFKLAGGLVFGVLGVIGAIVLAVVALPLLAARGSRAGGGRDRGLRPRRHRRRLLARLPHSGLDLLTGGRRAVFPAFPPLRAIAALRDGGQEPLW